VALLTQLLITTLLSVFGQLSVAQIVVTSGLNSEAVLRPGESNRFAIGVTNTGGEARTASIRFVDHQVIDGDNQFLEPGKLERSLANWLITRPSVSLEPGESITLFVDVQVPSNVNNGGTYWGVLLIEPDEATQATEVADVNRERGEGEDVTIHFRYRIRTAIQLVVNLPGNEKPQIDLRDPVVTRTPEGTIALRVAIANEGGRWARSSTLSLDVYEAQTGSKVMTSEQSVARLYPGSNWHATFDMGHLESGRYQLVLLAEVAGDVVAATRFDLDVEPQHPSPGPEGAP